VAKNTPHIVEMIMAARFIPIGASAIPSNCKEKSVTRVGIKWK